MDRHCRYSYSIYSIISGRFGANGSAFIFLLLSCAASRLKVSLEVATRRYHVTHSILEIDHSKRRRKSESNIARFNDPP